MESLLQGFLREQGYALFKPREDGSFVRLSVAPSWFEEIWGLEAGGQKPIKLGEASPYLENFLVEANEFWNSRDTDAQEVCASGTWVETPAGGQREIPLEAVAMRLEGEPVLSIHSPQKAFQEQSQVFQTARESKLAHERLLKEIQKKEILLHCIIHDLSQPLAAIRGCFECLATEPRTQKEKRFIDIGKQQAERQEGLIREILRNFAEDLKAGIGSPGEAGSGGSGAPDLLNCARETVAAFAPVFEAKGAAIQLSPKIGAGNDWKVAGDESRLRRICSNLVENALRYAPRESKVHVGVEEDGAYLRAFVDDEGPGLPGGSTAATLFSLLGKGKEGGGKAGLGLYFCRITVERWGGTIGCESRAEKGARFWFRLPRARAVVPAVPRAAPIAERKEAPRSGASRLRVLLAEDQEGLRELTVYLLQKEGHRVTAVGNGREALNALEKHSFDIVLLDEEMPDMNGTEVVRQIRQRERTTGGHQIVISVTGHASTQDEQRLLAAGMDRCMGKASSATELSRMLLAAVSPESPQTEYGAAVKPGAAEEDLLARVGGDAQLLQKITRTFLRDSVKRLAEMKRAVARKDGMALATAAHALKGSAAIFMTQGDSNAVAQRTQRLQEMGRTGNLGGAATVLSELEEGIALLSGKLRGYAKPGSAGGPGKQATKKHVSKTKRKRPVR